MITRFKTAVHFPLLRCTLMCSESFSCVTCKVLLLSLIASADSKMARNIMKGNVFWPPVACQEGTSNTVEHFEVSVELDPISKKGVAGSKVTWACLTEWHFGTWLCPYTETMLLLGFTCTHTQTHLTPTPTHTHIEIHRQHAAITVKFTKILSISLFLFHQMYFPINV